MSHFEIASVAEPWLLLPFVYSSKKDGVLSEYSHFSAQIALEDLINNLPGGESEYISYLNSFISNIYEALCHNGESYFLDKTPRYYLIIPEIVKIFPDAKFIFLFRNPIHVYSSIMHTWGANSFKQLFGNYIDLSDGPKKLSDGYELIKNKSCAVQYEKFVEAPEEHLKKILTYLGLGYEERMLNEILNQKTKGSLGDPTGINDYKKIEKETMKKWEKTFSTKFRKFIIRRYVNNLDNNMLKTQGYSKNFLLNEIKTLRPVNKRLLKDSFDYIFFKIIILLNVNLYFGENTKKWLRSKFIS